LSGNGSNGAQRRQSEVAIAEVTVIPIGTGTTSLSSYVADMQKILERQRGITYQLTSMSTIIEGPLNEVFTAIAALHEAPFLSGAQRVSTSVKIDDRRDKPDASSVQKLQSVQDKLISLHNRPN
jgi:uncharacterized protein (TIGR00106 family)